VQRRAKLSARGKIERCRVNIIEGGLFTEKGPPEEECGGDGADPGGAERLDELTFLLLGIGRSRLALKNGITNGVLVSLLGIEEEGYR